MIWESDRGENFDFNRGSKAEKFRRMWNGKEGKCNCDKSFVTRAKYVKKYFGQIVFLIFEKKRGKSLVGEQAGHRKKQKSAPKLKVIARCVQEDVYQIFSSFSIFSLASLSLSQVWKMWKTNISKREKRKILHTNNFFGASIRAAITMNSDWI